MRNYEFLRILRDYEFLGILRNYEYLRIFKKNIKFLKNNDSLGLFKLFLSNLMS